MPTLTFIEHDGTEHAVEAATGQTVMQAAVDDMIPGMVGQCGGDCTCGTCHGYVAVQAMAPATPVARPDVAQFLQMMPRFALPPDNTPATVQRMRADSLARGNLFDAPALALPLIRDLAMQGPDGPIPLRLYDCRPQREAGPVVVFYHGGGFVLGGFATHDAFCTAICAALDLPLVYVGYRLAPEHPFPAAQDDCEAAARWIAACAPELGLQSTGLALLGDSAGGSLVLSTALALRDRPAALPVMAQLAFYPMADRKENHASTSEFGDGCMLTREMLDWFESCYLPASSARAYPLQADLAGLPPTMIVTAALDPLRDQGRAYAAKCARSGVSTLFREGEGAIHGWLSFRKLIPSAQADLDRYLAEFRQFLASQAIQAATTL